MPTTLEAIEAHVRQIQQLCDATGRDPTEWLSDNVAQGSPMKASADVVKFADQDELTRARDIVSKVKI